MWDFPCSSLSKESACHAGDPGLNPGLGRFPGEGKGNPLQYSCLENPMDRGAWWATVQGATRVGHDLTTEQHHPFLVCVVFAGWGCCFFFFSQHKGFPGGSEVKASASNTGGLGSIPGSGRTSREGNGNPLQYSCLENPMDRGAW